MAFINATQKWILKRQQLLIIQIDVSTWDVFPHSPVQEQLRRNQNQLLIRCTGGVAGLAAFKKQLAPPAVLRGTCPPICAPRTFDRWRRSADGSFERDACRGHTRLHLNGAVFIHKASGSVSPELTGGELQDDGSSWHRCQLNPRPVERRAAHLKEGRLISHSSLLQFRWGWFSLCACSFPPLEWFQLFPTRAAFT